MVRQHKKKSSMAELAMFSPTDGENVKEALATHKKTIKEKLYLWTEIPFANTNAKFTVYSYISLISAVPRNSFTAEPRLPPPRPATEARSGSLEPGRPSRARSAIRAMLDHNSRA